MLPPAHAPATATTTATATVGDINDIQRLPRRFYSLIEGESLEVPLFKTSTKMCFESLGWLLTVELDGSMSLVDPVSRTEIPLPHLRTFRGSQSCRDKRFSIHKMALSSRPAVEGTRNDFILMVIIGNCLQLAFWRFGDKAWNKIHIHHRGFRVHNKGFCDLVYAGGQQFYAITCRGYVWVINPVVGRHVECRRSPGFPVLCSDNTQRLYILKTISGSLLGIKRSRDTNFFLADSFRAYDIDIKTGKWKERYTLGSMAVFLGRNSSFAVDASASNSNSNGRGGVIKPNHIYFTDDFREYQLVYFIHYDGWRTYTTRGSPDAKGGSVDCGVFDFDTKSIEPIYPVEPLLTNVCPAMWITPN